MNPNYKLSKKYKRARYYSFPSMACLNYNKKLFEKHYEKINHIILQRKSKWTLAAVAWLDYDDVKQIILFHVYKKIHLWDQNKPIEPWLNTLIRNQIANLLRNLFSNFSRPCLKCSAAEGDECSIYGQQCSNCPLFAYWRDHKKSAHDIKLPVTIENHIQEVYDIPEDNINLLKSIELFNHQIKFFLTPLEYKVYKILYIQHKGEEEAALVVKKESDKIYSDNFYLKQITLIKKKIISKAWELVKDKEIELFG